MQQLMFFFYGPMDYYKYVKVPNCKPKLQINLNLFAFITCDCF